MANEIVKYHHELNTIPLRKFTPVEMNLFFSIVSRMREKGDKTVRFTFDQLKDLSNYKATANVRFVEDLKQLMKKSYLYALVVEVSLGFLTICL